MRTGTIVVAALGVLALGAILIAASYIHDMAAARARLAAGRKTVMTAVGNAEYGERGSGRPVLVIHGAGGGFDQGMMLGEYHLAMGTGSSRHRASDTRANRSRLTALSTPRPMPSRASSTLLASKARCQS